MITKSIFSQFIGNLINKNHKRFTSNAINEPNFGLLFDIDGVLLRGKQLLPRTKACIQLITNEHGKFKIPTIFLTNAGNELKSSKAIKLSNLLGVKISPEQVVMSHSPLKMFRNFHNKHCLISGQGPIIEIAKNLGFTRVTTVDDLRQSFPMLDVVDHKRRVVAPCVLGRYFPPIEAIVLFGEPVRWETHLQLITDILMSHGKIDDSHGDIRDPHLPVLACNTDFVWMSEASMPRFGHGTFLHCLEQIYSKLSNQQLKYSALVGKPAELTYLYAENCLKQHAKALGLNSKLKRIYAIGDNVDTDIYGANVYNQILENNLILRERKQQLKASTDDTCLSSDRSDILNGNLFADDMDACSVDSCESILVCTGVYRSDFQSKIKVNYGHRDMIVDDSLKKPKYICNDVYDAVDLVLNMECN